jgi:malonyl-CoA decarboxylase
MCEGLMVNYLYDLRFIDSNHETLADSGSVVASDEVERRLRTFAPAVMSENRHV